MRWTGWIVAACVVLAASMGSAQAPAPKLALVIGNSDYNGGGIDVSPAGLKTSRDAGYQYDLQFATRDAQLVRDRLRALGYSVQYLENADALGMLDALTQFGRDIRRTSPSAVTIFYYAGHAIQTGGDNYLIPARARLITSPSPSADEVSAVIAQQTVSAAHVRAQLSPRTGPGLHVVIFDSCRNNPWVGMNVGAAGLADMRWTLNATVIAYSTEPGNTAYDGTAQDQHSPYALALFDALATPTENLLQTFNRVSSTVSFKTKDWPDGPQRPWTSFVSLPKSACMAGGGCQQNAGEPTQPRTRLVHETANGRVTGVRDCGLAKQQLHARTLCAQVAESRANASRQEVADVTIGPVTQLSNVRSKNDLTGANSCRANYSVVCEITLRERAP